MKAPLQTMVARGDDPTGHGHFGASRGSRTHKGWDVIASPKDCVTCPIDGTITKLGQVYSSTTDFKYIEISNDTYRIRLMYVKKVGIKKGDGVCEGDGIGLVQNIAAYHKGGMLNHMHIQVWKNRVLVDPEPLFL